VKVLTAFIKKDRGVSIPGCSIGCDFEIAQDYSMNSKTEELTKYQDYYENV